MSDRALSSEPYRCLVVPLAVCAVLAALSLCESSWHYVGLDQGGWTYVGWAWEAHGMAPYSGTMDNKTPGIHMLYAVFVRCFGIGIWPHAVAAAVALVVAALVVYALALRLYDRAAGGFALLLFALAVTLPALNGALYVEPFVAMFSTAAFYAVLTPSRQTTPAGSERLLLAGASMALAVLFKQTAIFDALALCIVAGMIEARRSDCVAGVVRGVALLVIGMALATLLSLAPLLAAGTTLRQYWEGGWLLLLKPGTAARLANRVYNFILVWGGMNMRIPLFYPLVLLFILQRKRLQALSVPWDCLAVWLGLKFLGVNASGQLWGHQVQEILPSLSVVSGIGLSAAIRAVFRRRASRRACAVWAAAAICLFWAPVDLFDAACQRIHARAKGETPPLDTRRLIGLWLREHVPYDDSLFVWSRNAGAIYAYAQKLAPSRFFDNHFAGNAEVAEEIQQAIRRQPPRFVVVEKDPYPSIPGWLQEWIEQNYAPLDEQFGYVILKQKS